MLRVFSWRRKVQQDATARRHSATVNVPVTDCGAERAGEQIGSDARLLDIQRLLPPHYTTVYAVTLLTDEELKRAIAENIVYPGMTRAELQKWHRELSRKVELARSPRRWRGTPPSACRLFRRKTLSRVVRFLHHERR